jgi:hypothetical protein
MVVEEEAKREEVAFEVEGRRLPDKSEGVLPPA